MSRRTVRLALVVVLLLAFGLRFALFRQLSLSPIADMLAVDSEFYHDWAKAIAGGAWLGDRVFDALPVYPYALGVLYSVFGPSIRVARFAQVLLGTFNCFLLFCIGRRLLGAPVALLGTFMMAAFQWIVLYDCSILSPIVAIFVSLLLLLVLIRAQEKRYGPAVFLAAGLLAGVAVATAAQVSMFVLLVAFWIVLSRPLGNHARRLALLAAFIAGMCLPVSAIACRNWYAGNDFVPLTAHGGINFYIGNNPDSRGLFDPPPTMRTHGASLQADSVLLAEKAVGRPLKPSEVSSYWFGRGFEFIARQPLRAARLMIAKLELFFFRAEIADVIHPQVLAGYAPVLNLPMFGFGLVAPLGLLGMVVAWPLRRKLVLAYMFVISWTLSVMLFFVNSRYRVPVVPLLAIFAAYAIHWLVSASRRRRFPAVTAALGLLALFALFVNPPQPRATVNPGAGHNHLAVFLTEKGKLREALAEYKRAAGLEPGRAEAQYNLGVIYYRLAEYDAALAAFGRAVQINPEYQAAFMNMGSAYRQLGRHREAFDTYLHVVRTFPESLTAYRRLALRYHDNGTVVPELEQLLAEAPDGGRIHAELGKIASVFDVNRPMAVHHLEKALARLPGDYTLHLYLGNNYYYLERIDDARAQWRAALKLRPGDKTVAEMLRQTEDGGRTTDDR